MKKTDQNFISFCNELRAYVQEHHHFPNKHTNLLSKVKYVRRKINEGAIEDWKKALFIEIAEMRDMEEHTGGRRKISQ